MKNPSKLDVARAIILRSSLFVHLDPRKPGVLVPARLRSQPQVVLQIGLDMPVPITDLRVDGEGIFGTLSFRGVGFTCFVPWGAVFALVGEDKKGFVYGEDMPAEIAKQLEDAARKPKLAAVRGAGPKAPATAPRGQLFRVK
jgi:stringent starvation protein B